MDAEKAVENKNESYAVASKCDEEADVVDEDAKNKQERNENEGVAAAAKQLKKMIKFQMKMWRFRRLIEERSNTARREKQHLKEVSKQIRK